MLRRIILALTLVGAAGWAQPGRGSAIRSPEVSADGKVTFRLRAPNAKEVAVTGLGDRLVMVKDDQGIWSVTTGPLQPDLYQYSFSVDGAAFNDPANPLLKPTYGAEGQSMVRVPGDAPWIPGAGPFGAVTHHTYHSALIGAERDYYVYTPPNYDPNRKEPYPVLVLIHGLTDDSSTWTTVGAANVILDNLINQGKAKPMIMVNPLGYGTADGVRGAMRAEMIPAFAKALLEEVLPQVEKNYHVAKDREHHAIAGLSMGGAEALYTGLNHPERFAYVLSFSGAFVMWPRASSPQPPAAGAQPGPGPGGRGPQRMADDDFARTFPDLTANAASQLRMLWIGCGTDDSLMNVNRQFRTWLKSKDIKFTEPEIPGFAHVWPLWRRNLAEVAPQLF